MEQQVMKRTAIAVEKVMHPDHYWQWRWTFCVWLEDGQLREFTGTGTNEKIANKLAHRVWMRLDERGCGPEDGTRIKTNGEAFNELPDNDLDSEADVEYSTRIDAQRCTLQFGQKSARRIDAGRKPITESPLFGGAAQGDLF